MCVMSSGRVMNESVKEAVERSVRWLKQAAMTVEPYWLTPSQVAQLSQRLLRACKSTSRMVSDM